LCISYSFVKTRQATVWAHREGRRCSTFLFYFSWADSDLYVRSPHTPCLSTAIKLYNIVLYILLYKTACIYDSKYTHAHVLTHHTTVCIIYNIIIYITYDRVSGAFYLLVENDGRCEWIEKWLVDLSTYVSRMRKASVLE